MICQLTQRSFLRSSHSSVRLLFVPANRPPLVTDLIGEGFDNLLKVEHSEGSFSLIGDALDANHFVMLIAALRQRGWTLLSHDVVSVASKTEASEDCTIVTRTFLFEKFDESPIGIAHAAERANLLDFEGAELVHRAETELADIA